MHHVTTELCKVPQQSISYQFRPHWVLQCVLKQNIQAFFLRLTLVDPGMKLKAACTRTSGHRQQMRQAYLHARATLKHWHEEKQSSYACRPNHRVNTVEDTNQDRSSVVFTICTISKKS